ncbi:MAG: hypothetical protein KU38_07730 [Sulfurovum sp. FS08-3]|nr:MAG: hypothetical protein KU38_07730 [Sulfurovum sp. FS08-3]
MNEHFITEIEIKNFKLFKDFKAEGFGRVNLIGGKNNVGKTAFMEAVFVNVCAQNLESFIGSLQNIKYMREELNILSNILIERSKPDVTIYMEQSSGINIQSNKNDICFMVNKNNGIKSYHFKFNGKTIDVSANEFSFEVDVIPNIGFIDNFGLPNFRIKLAYASVLKKDKEQFLNDILYKFDNRIGKFISVDTPQCRLNGEWFDLTELGDGTKHLVSIVTSLFKSENGYLFIDELDNGIHYTQLDELWEIILTISKEQNVQVFATTHSKECIESYARVAKRLGDEEITFIELCRRENEIKSFVYPYSWFLDEIAQEHEVRGCL